jgi:lipopolysaccharide/colanic/teichoic acid biosynthesis glycosyltransferase
VNRSHRLTRPLQYLGVVLTVLWWSKVHAARVAPEPYDFTESFRLRWAVAYMISVCVATYAMGLPDLPRRRVTRVVLAVSSVALATGVVAMAQLAVGSAVLPRFVLAASAAVLVPWLVLVSSLSSDLAHVRGARERVVLVASPGEVLTVRDELTNRPEQPATVVGAIDPRAVAQQPGAHVLEMATACHASMVVLSKDAQTDEVLVAQASELHRRGVRVRTLNQFYEEWLGKMSISELERIALLFDISEVHRRRYLRLKRLMDLTVVVVGLPVLLVVTPLVMVGNALANRGPLLFRQDRVGKDGKVFAMVKFRTMRVHDGTARDGHSGQDVHSGQGGHSSHDGGHDTWTVDDDPRITPFGAVLRRVHLDELPQLINIARGHLSIVGPRPEQVAYVEELRDKVPCYDLRHLVRPGLTGWAQVKFRYGASEIDALEKLQYEFYYLRHQSLVLDGRVMARTVRHVLGAGGR